GRALRHLAPPPAKRRARGEAGMKAVMAATILATGVVAILSMSAEAQPAARSGATTPALESGKRLYARGGAPCHAADPRLAGTLAPQHKYGGELPAALEDRTGLTPATVAESARNGGAAMASLRKTEISDAELAAMGAYLSAPLTERGAHAELLADEMMREHGGRP